MTTLALNTILAVLAMAAVAAYYCRLDVLKYGRDPLGLIAVTLAGGASAAWSFSQGVQMQAGWAAWAALVASFVVLSITYGRVRPAQRVGRFSEVVADRGGA